ncbi:UNVERIFIED_ORG: MFS family permease [Arthrobacter sp. UYCu721]
MQPPHPAGEAGRGQSLGSQPPWGPQPGPAQPPWGGQPVWGPPPGGQPVWGPPPGGPPAWGTPPHNPYGAPPPYQQPRYVAPPKPGIIPLRPLLFGEILDGSFQAIRRNAKAMLGAALLAQTLAAVLTAVLTAFSATSAASLETWAEGLTEQDLVPVVLTVASGVVLVSVLTVFLSAVLQGAMVVPVARSVLNRTTGFRQMWSLTRSRAGALIRLAALLVGGGLLVTLLFVALAVLLVSTVGGVGALILIPLGLVCFVLYVWIYTKLMVAPAAVVVEELGAVAGIRRSWELTRNSWWRLLGITLVVGIMVGVIAQIVTIPVSLLSGFYTGVVSPHGGADQAMTAAVVAGVATAIVGAVVGAVGFAFQTSVMALLYLDLRMRRDGLDIALLRLLESGADPDGVPGRGVPVYRAGPGQNPRPPYGAPAGGAWPDGR